MNAITENILYEIEVVKLKQPAIAQILAMVIMAGQMEAVDWKEINKSIRKRWSLSARERVLTMAWKIVEQAKTA